MAIAHRLHRSLWAYWLYGAATLLVMAPLLLPGYILTLDMVFTPSIPLPDHLTSSYPLYVVLHVLNFVLPSQLIQKLLLIGVLLGSMVGMHRLIMYIHGAEKGPIPWATVSASLLFAVNPFTYDRFMAGQYHVLLGYALLPWLLRAGLQWGRIPGAQQTIRLGLLLVVVGIVSLHTLGIAGLMGISAGLVYGLAYYRRDGWLARRAKQLAVIGALFLAGSSYWLLPALLGRGRTAETVNRFTTADAQAFATTGSNVVQQVANIMQLQGFWAETRHLFILPQSAFVLWGIVVLLLWALVIYGVRAMWRSRPKLALTLLLAMLLAGVTALGVPIRLLSEIIPLAGGYREPQKFVAIWALGYCLFAAYGGATLLRHSHKRPLAYTSTALALLLIPLLLTPTMWWGFRGQLTPRHYPAGWYDMRALLETDNSHGAVLFLPWHQYMSYGFAGRIIASPAENFFASKTMIVSDDPELGGAIATTATSQTVAVGKLLDTAAHNPQLARSLRDHTIKYVLLAKDYDYREYRYLDHTPGLQLVAETSTLKLYRNTTWRPSP
jgi:hypothetical protein